MIRGTRKTDRSRRAIQLFLTADPPITLSDASRRVGLRYRPRLASRRRLPSRITLAVQRLLNPTHPRHLLDVTEELGISPTNVYAQLKKLGMRRGMPRSAVSRMALAVRLFQTSDPPLTLRQVARFYQVSMITLEARCHQSPPASPQGD